MNYAALPGHKLLIMQILEDVNVIHLSLQPQWITSSSICIINAKRLLRFISTFSLVFAKCNLLCFRLIVIYYLLLSPPETKANLYPVPNNRLAFVSFNSGLTDEILWSILRRGCQNLKSLDLSLSPHFLTEFAILCIGKSHINVPLMLDPGGGTLGISGWGCAAGTLGPLTYTRASSAEFCYPVLE